MIEKEIHNPLGVFLLFKVAKIGYLVFCLSAQNFVALLLKKGGNYSMKSIHVTSQCKWPPKLLID